MHFLILNENIGEKKIIPLEQTFFCTWMSSSFVSEDFDIYSFKVILPIKLHYTSLNFYFLSTYILYLYT